MTSSDSTSNNDGVGGMGVGWWQLWFKVASREQKSGSA